MQALYQKMGDALIKSGRPILFSLCQYGRAEVWKWGPEVGGNAWRTTGDIRDTWDSMTKIGFDQDELGPYASPGHWNDPDMLEIGNGGMTDDEYKTHMTLWSMLAAPLLAGNDLRSMSDSIREILLNREVIAIDQDKEGKQGRRLSKSGIDANIQEIWTRQLSGGAQAIALFNRGPAPAKMTIKWSDAGLESAHRHVRDLWSHTDVKLDAKLDAASAAEYSATVPSHGVVLLRLSQ
jgi:alpha-galactosidase